MVVGVNAYAEEGGIPEEGLTIDPAIEREQVERLRALRDGRDGARTRAALAALRRAAVDGANSMPSILECVRAQATLGEIADELRAVWGEHTDDGGGL